MSVSQRNLHCDRPRGSGWRVWTAQHGLRERVYLVTGGSRGLGFAAAEALIADGAYAVISGPHVATASAAAARLERHAATVGSAGWVVADNRDPVTPAQLVAAGKDRLAAWTVR